LLSIIVQFLLGARVAPEWHLFFFNRLPFGRVIAWPEHVTNISKGSEIGSILCVPTYFQFKIPH
jgi:hypothetical protein